MKTIKRIAPVLFIVLILSACGRSGDSYTADGYLEEIDSDWWSVSYYSLDGYKQRELRTANQENHTLLVRVETLSGALDMTITGRSGTVYYQGEDLATGEFMVDTGGEDRLTVLVDAQEHMGGFNVGWA